MSLGRGWGFAVNNFYAGEQAEARRMVELGPLAEEAGFDSVWLGDHILWHTPMIDATALLAAFAANTERVTLGTAVLLLGIRQPAMTAKFLTSLNVICDGRLVIGVGVGGENPAEFEFAGVPHNRRGRLLDDALTLLTSQWDESAPGTKVDPVGPPLEILVGGRTDASRARIQRFGTGWLAAFVSPRRIRDEVELLREASDGPVPVALNIYLRTGKDHDKARAEAADFLSNVYAMEAEPLMRYSAAGSFDACAEELAAYARAGVEHFILRPAGWDQTEQLDQWATELLPRLAGVWDGG